MSGTSGTFFFGTSWNHFRKHKPAMISLYVLALFLFIALLAPVIANEKPWYVKYNGESYFPAFSLSPVIEITNKESGKQETYITENIDWQLLKPEKIIHAPIAYSPGKSDPVTPDYFAPSMRHHLLGTGKNGSDVLSGLIHGARISLSIGILSMLIASLIGLALGSFAGYFGDGHLATTRGKLWMMFIGILPAYFYGFYIHGQRFSNMLSHPGLFIPVQIVFSVTIFSLMLIIFYKAGNLLHPVPFFSKKIFFHADSLVSRIIEVFTSIPRLIFIITIAAIATPSFISLVLIIGFTSWTEIARFTRAELLRARNAGYIESARVLGLSDVRIILKHALPNAMAPATVAIVFGVASAILVESGLSFLGIGVPHDVVTWGSLLNGGRENFDAWWLVIFPGLAIFITVTAFNLLGDGLRDALDVRSRNT